LLVGYGEHDESSEYSAPVFFDMALSLEPNNTELLVTAKRFCKSVQRTAFPNDFDEAPYRDRGRKFCSGKTYAEQLFAVNPKSNWRLHWQWLASAENHLTEQEMKYYEGKLWHYHRERDAVKLTLIHFGLMQDQGEEIEPLWPLVP
jgi:hypothetical protein